MYSEGTLYIAVNNEIIKYVFVEGEWKPTPSCQEQQ